MRPCTHDPDLARRMAVQCGSIRSARRHATERGLLVSEKPANVQRTALAERPTAARCAFPAPGVCAERPA